MDQRRLVDHPPEVPAREPDHRVDCWNGQLGLSLHCNDAVDFHRNVFVRRIRVKNDMDVGRLVKVFHHQDFLMFGTRIGDTAYYDPELRGMVHYRPNAT